MNTTNTTEKTYSPQDIEQQWYSQWEANGYFAPTGEGESFCIMLPPPNVTGSLHMGHGFGYTLIDILVRYERMCGKNTLWQPGIDHAGISTQMVVERQVMAQGGTRHTVGREKFVEKIWEWKAESGGNITRQMRRLGASVDWSRERFTLDDDFSHAVREVFISLYNEGLIYRGTKLVNWDPVLLTAISDLEVLNEEVDGNMWHIRYPLVDGTGHIIVATTRPETMLGDVAVAVHPDDDRYKQLIGKSVQLPLTDRTIPIIADNYVDPLFGTGCVKITPAHDFNDYAVGVRHHLAPINIFTPTATINENAPSAYQGLDRFKARTQIIKDLTSQDLIEKIDKHKLKVPRGEKSGAVIEPYFTPQWFMRMKPLAEPAIKVVENGELRFIPEGWNKTYFQWMNNIEDWCISRQLWWGHRIPVWYDESGTVYVGQDENDVRERHQLGADIVLTQEEDVLDTWVSAALWPFSSLGWPKETPELQSFFPTNILVTGFDIIFFWVARMIMLSLKFTKKVPFHDVYITGLIRDAEGHKMSKSKGNVLDPIDMIDGITLDELIKKRTYGLMQPHMAEKIEKATRKEFPEGIPSYGTDALRFTYCAIASYTRDISFDTHRLGGSRNFCNKLWNATRYVMMNTEGQDAGLQDTKMSLSLPDRWIRSRLQQTIEKAHGYLADYRFDLFAQALYDFTWNEFCDWYLELSKPILTSTDSTPEMLRGTRHTLVAVLEQLLRLLHPIMPFLTEELWQRVAPLADKRGDTIMLAPYPEYNAVLVDAEAVKEIEWLKQVVIAIRTIRSEMNIAPGKRLAIILRHGTELDKSNEAKHRGLLLNLAKLESLAWLDDNVAPPPSATALAGHLEIFIPMAGFIDVAEEQARLAREIAKAEKEWQQILNKLANAQFVDRAPAEVVAKEKARCAELEMVVEKLKKQLESTAALS